MILNFEIKLELLQDQLWTILLKDLNVMGIKNSFSFLSISKDPVEKLRSQSYSAFDYKYINQDILDELISWTDSTQQENSSSFIAYLKKSEFKGSKYHISEP